MSNSGRHRRQITAIVFSDIVGYTALMGSDEAFALQLLTENRKIHRESLNSFGGELLKEMGDGNLMSFSSAVDAVRCAMEIQRKTRNTDLEQKLRIGIHLGDVSRNNQDVFGDGVNIASRLQSVADPGGIYLSEDVEHMIRSQKEIPLKKLGRLKLKNVSSLVQTYAVQGPGYPIPGTLRRWHRKPIEILVSIMLIIACIYGIWSAYETWFRTYSIEAVAILPFDDLSADPEGLYFAEGMTRTLVSYLGKVSELRVIWNTSVQKMHVAGFSDIKIGKQLKVDAIIKGSMLREGEQIRVIAQMTNARTGELIWTDSYDQEMTSVLKLHSQVAQAIVQQVSVAATRNEMEEIQEAPLVNPQVFELLLKGFSHLYKLNPEHHKIALKYFQQVLAIEPENAQALAGIAFHWVHRGQWGGVDPVVAGENARKYAEKSLALDPDNSIGILTMCTYYVGYAWNWEGADAMFKKSIAINPNQPEPRLFYADLLVSLHRNAEALRQVNMAVSMDPLNAFSHCMKGWVHFAVGEFDSAINAFTQSLDYEPNLSLALRCMWTIHHLREEYDQAVEYAAAFYFSQDLVEIADFIEETYEKHIYNQTMKLAAEHLALLSEQRYVSAMRVARLYTVAEENDQALTWLEKAFDEHYPSIFSMNVDPHWQRLHSERRFVELVQKIGLTLDSY